MKYNLEKLQQIKEEVAKFKGPIGDELNRLITRCIVIKQEFEEVEKQLMVPEGDKTEFLEKHMQLIVEYQQNRERQIYVLQLVFGDSVQDISVRLEEDYHETVKLIKS